MSRLTSSPQVDQPADAETLTDERRHRPATQSVGTPPVKVAISSTDRITEDGARAWLRACPRLDLLPPARRHEADVLLLLAMDVSDTVLNTLRQHRDAADHAAPVVLVAESMTERQLVTAVDHGLVGFLNRCTTGYPEIAAALVGASQGQAHIPGILVRHILREIQTRRHSHVMDRAGLHAREVAVVRMLAEGSSTSSIAAQLGYSERTIKGIIHEMVKRLGLQNRIQAVAYAVRTGAI
ncbi:LuxR C-terminal-related transcriptional regulator [Streptomyces sp. NPDC087659]|uniref:helix-turn-helix transcriptional regulator n=1 Tax=Streptomyces sp. NPDC087659 TaxID=3365801 RepID=UPI003826B833